MIADDRPVGMRTRLRQSGCRYATPSRSGYPASPTGEALAIQHEAVRRRRAYTTFSERLRGIACPCVLGFMRRTPGATAKLLRCIAAPTGARLYGLGISLGHVCGTSLDLPVQSGFTRCVDAQAPPRQPRQWRETAPVLHDSFFGHHRISTEPIWIHGLTPEGVRHGLAPSRFDLFTIDPIAGYAT